MAPTRRRAKGGRRAAGGGRRASAELQHRPCQCLGLACPRPPPPPPPCTWSRPGAALERQDGAVGRAGRARGDSEQAAEPCRRADAMLARHPGTRILPT